MISPAYVLLFSLAISGAAVVKTKNEAAKSPTIFEMTSDLQGNQELKEEDLNWLPEFSKKSSQSKSGWFDVEVKISKNENRADSSENMKNFTNTDAKNVGNGSGNRVNKRSVDSDHYFKNADGENQTLRRFKREFVGSLAIHDMRTKPGPPVNIENLHGYGSAHIVIDDNTDPVTLRNAKIYGSAKIQIGG